ncbi:LTV1 homolog (S. cerevisiae) [Nesidiocoris tenuis]|uniref:LTV1 homolog (S. cerevisiae) n=1 Tax=Nesidiocoris tenuis TaxID=355587 RepID=A0ABN7AJ16_9HEMI|nr:LTV1 homolog (S. cerevisiae) [Nesidiocoris tenuis]
MGTWKLEVGKMALYMMFPVATFYLFNQPQYFEEYVTSMKRDFFPPENPEHRKMLEETIANINKREELAMLKALEEKRKKG